MKKQNRTIRHGKEYLFTFKRMSLRDRLIIFLFERKGYKKSPRVCNDQWTSPCGELSLVHDENGWRQYHNVKHRVIKL